MTYALIVYLNMSYNTAGGGPVSVQGFSSKEACETAALYVRAEFPHSYQGHVCIRVTSS